MAVQCMRAMCLLATFVGSVSEVVLLAEKTDKGIITSVSVGKLMMTDSEGKNEHAYVIPMEAKVMLNDREAKITDLEKGDAVTVTMGREGEVMTVSAKRTKKPPTKLSQGAAVRDEMTVAVTDLGLGYWVSL
jgi:phosphohistidine swiveling domain-containing protein